MTVADHPLNQAIDRMIVAEMDTTEDLLAKVRSMCAELPIEDLRVAIDVHRTSCHLDSCPVLGAMQDHARTRRVSP